jgi:hypothetical protein
MAKVIHGTPISANVIEKENALPSERLFYEWQKQYGVHGTPTSANIILRTEYGVLSRELLHI